MNISTLAQTALSAPNKSVDIDGRSIAYRRWGTGPDLVLCARFRGIMDSWDPLFLDRLAMNFTVTIFDYSGLGYSTGEPSYARKDMAKDVNDLVDALGLKKVVIGGWSIGGIAAMVFAASFPDKVSHVIAIATMPPGLMVKPTEPIFLSTAMKPINTVDDEYILFFDPNSDRSRSLANASIARIADRNEVTDYPTPAEVFINSVMASSDPSTPFPDPNDTYSDFFKATSIPVLALSGDHDPMFPVENWYALNDLWPTLFVATWPESGHGPQHQYPEMSAELIASFVKHTPAG